MLEGLGYWSVYGLEPQGVDTGFHVTFADCPGAGALLARAFGHAHGLGCLHELSRSEALACLYWAIRPLLLHARELGEETGVGVEYVHKVRDLLYEIACACQKAPEKGTLRVYEVFPGNVQERAGV